MAEKKTSPARSAKASADKPSRARSAAAANPVRTKDVSQAPPAPKAADAAGASPRLPFRRPPSLNFADVGRNDICPCGSGKRFKNCHGH